MKKFKRLVLLFLLTLSVNCLAHGASQQDKKVKMNGSFPRGACTIIVKTLHEDPDSAVLFLKRELIKQDIVISKYDKDIQFLQTDIFPGADRLASIQLRIVIVKDGRFCTFRITPYYISNVNVGLYAYGAAVSSTPNLQKLVNRGMEGDVRRDNYHALIWKLNKTAIKQLPMELEIEPK